MKNKLSKRIIFIAVAAVGVLAILFNSCTVIKAGEVGIVTTFGKAEKRILTSGFNWKSPFQKIVKINIKEQVSSIGTLAFTSDIQEVSIQNVSINYNIDNEAARKLYATIGENYFDIAIKTKFIENVKVVISHYTAEQLIANRSSLPTEIYDITKPLCDSYGINLIRINLEDIDFTDEFTSAIEAKQVATQKKITAETEQATLTMQAKQEAERKIIEAEAAAKAKIIEAEADAEANEKVSASLNDKILTKMFYERWNGILPIVTGSTSGIILPSDIFSLEQ